MDVWGKSVAIDIRDCAPEVIKSAAALQDWVIQLVKKIDMVRYDDCHIVHFGKDNKKGYTLVQLIETSNITAHFSESSNRAYIDVFSCKDFDEKVVAEFSAEFFGGEAVIVGVNLRE